MRSVNACPETSVSPRTCFDGILLESAFQPIFGLRRRRVVGFEALLRGQTPTGQDVPPLRLFGQANEVGRAAELDALSQAVHIDNFMDAAPADVWLFLNISPAGLPSLLQRDDFGPLIERAGLPAHRLVVEMLEGAASDEGLLREAVAYFRALGAVIALDDFGAGHSNFDRIFRLTPDIIKLDRQMMADALQPDATRLQRLLPNLVSLMHEAGSLVLAEGIETEDQALRARDADIDFLQGYYLARPEPNLLAGANGEQRLRQMAGDFKASTIAREQAEKAELAPYIHAFQTAAARYFAGALLPVAAEVLLAMPRTLHCFVLNHNGEQLAEVIPSDKANGSDRRFAPIQSRAEDCSFRRRYFRSARNEPGRVQVSQHYVSSDGTRMCTTISLCYEREPQHVFCMDLELANASC